MKNQEAFTYCWTDHRDNKLYVGYHKGQQDDGYICSSKWMLEEYKKRPEDFTRMILAEGTAEDCRALEETILVATDAARSERFYNRHNGGKNFVGGPCTEESKKKKSRKMKGMKGRSHPMEERKRMSDIRKEGIKKGKIITWNKGKKCPQMSRTPWNKGVSPPQKLRDQWSKAHKGQIPWIKGKHHRADSIQKIIKNGRKGLHNTPQQNKKISKALSGKVQEKITCPFCNKTGGKNSMSRYHFDNCKHRI